MTVRIFVSYSHLDDAHRLRLTRHMAALEREKDVVIWFDGDIEPGREITPAIRKQLRQTDIFLALGSSNYLHSDYCYRREYRSMLRKAKQGHLRVLVALVGICDWPNTEMAWSKMLPDDAKSVEEHGRPNRAYLQIVQGLRRTVRSVRQEKGKEQAEADRKAADKVKPAAVRQRTKASGPRETRPSVSDARKLDTKPSTPKAKPMITAGKAKPGEGPTRRSISVKPKTTSGTSAPRRSPS